MPGLPHQAGGKCLPTFILAGQSNMGGLGTLGCNMTMEQRRFVPFLERDRQRSADVWSVGHQAEGAGCADWSPFEASLK
eukprot:3891924-Prymnesium_polylepis.1